MHRILFFLLFTSLVLVSCKNTSESNQFNDTNVASSKVESIGIVSKDSTIASRFTEPKGFIRITVEEGSFASYLRNFKLLPVGEKVHLYDGSVKWSQDLHASILNIDVGNRDLQQCADAVMRLRAEYLYAQQNYDKIAFNFTNGWKFEYNKWREGNNLIVKGNNTSWKPSENLKTSYKDFRKYLDKVFMYAGTLSLSKELKSKTLESINIGDVLIQGGSPGHAVLVMDVCKNEDTGDKAFMLAQSYMPAQQIHVLKNTENQKASPWYLLSEIRDQIVTPEWAFYKTDLKEF